VLADVDTVSLLVVVGEDNFVNKVKLDIFTFSLAVFVIMAICIPLVLFPTQGNLLIQEVYNFMTYHFGFLDMWVGLGVFIFAMWISFSKHGDIHLGDVNEAPEFSTFQWASMLFCAGIGSGVMYWGTIEWAYYFQSPPFHLAPGSWDAAEIAATYGIYHWGPIGWALYSVPALPIAYSYFVKKDHVFKISESLRPLLGKYTGGYIGKCIDVFFIFGAVGATATSLGLGTPMIAAGLSYLLGIPLSIKLKIVSLVIVTVLFSASAYSGLKKGIQRLSTINIYFMFLILVFVFVFGPTQFILRMGTTSIGLLAQNFFRMSTWMDPVLNGGFPESWTVFYWAWWIISAPLLGLFIARISKGRSVRGLVLGSIGYGTAGCALMFIILGNLGLNLQLEGQLDVVSLLNSSDAPHTIIMILSTLKHGKWVVGLFTIVAIIFTATTFDSISYILATTTTQSVDEDQEPARWNRLFWAFLLAFLPGTLLLIDGPLKTIQTTAIITSVPVIFILLGMIVSFIKMIE